jgi:hypothetical protein
MTCWFHLLVAASGLCQICFQACWQYPIRYVETVDHGYHKMFPVLQIECWCLSTQTSLKPFQFLCLVYHVSQSFVHLHQLYWHCHSCYLCSMSHELGLIIIKDTIINELHCYLIASSKTSFTITIISNSISIWLVAGSITMAVMSVD